MSVTEAQLRAAIFEAPDDDERRLVYVDWLLERGEPLGRFISAQLTDDRATAKELVEVAIARSPIPFRETREQLDAAAKVFDFARGFLIRAGFTSRSPLPFVEADSWPVIESLVLGASDDARTVAAIAARLTCLRAFDCQTGDALKALAHFRPRPLTELRVDALTEWFDFSALIDERTNLNVTIQGALTVHASHRALPLMTIG